jgi:hypothetical protein
LTFSIQIAAIITLAEANFGINTNGMAAYTMQITWSVSILTLFPLTYVVFMKDILGDPKTSTAGSQSATSNPHDMEEKGREFLRIFLFLVCLLLSIYPFLGSMISMYGPSGIGNTSGSVISVSNWLIIQNICFEGVSFITARENSAMQVFLTLSWVIIYSFTVGKLLVDIASRTNPNPNLECLGRLKEFIPDLIRPLRGIPWDCWPLILIPLLCISQFWTYLRLHQAQKQIAESSQNPFLDNQWSFGQIVAITVFTPVIIECLFWTRLSTLSDRYPESDVASGVADELDAEESI